MPTSTSCNVVAADDTEIENFRQQLCGLTENVTGRVAIEKLYTDLEKTGCSFELAQVICKLIAELSKDEKCRDCFVDREFMPLINRHLEKCITGGTPDRSDDVYLLEIQICRAIGNLCFYNGTYL